MSALDIIAAHNVLIERADKILTQLFGKDNYYDTYLERHEEKGAVKIEMTAHTYLCQNQWVHTAICETRLFDCTDEELAAMLEKYPPETKLV